MLFQKKALPSFAKIDTIAKTYATKASVVDCATQTKLTALEVSTKFLFL